MHPGYGFLSENADFAEACDEAGLVFIGPPAAAMRAMGSKAAAKALMARAGVPLVPGYHGAEQDPGRLLDEARQIGFPVLIKASAGGGGRGMRIVAEAGEFAAALEAARREALGAFGDDADADREVPRPGRAISRCRSSPTGTAISSTSSTATARSSAAIRR